MHFGARLLYSSMLAALAGLLVTNAGHAAEVTALTIDDQAKKIVLTYTISPPFKAEAVYEYVKNVIVLKVEGLELSSKQKRSAHLPASGETEQFYRNTMMRDMEGGGEILVVLGKLCTPADAQVVPLDNKIVVEIVKPLWKLEQEAAETPTDPAAGDAAPNGSTDTPADPAPEQTPADTPTDDAAAPDAVDGWDDTPDAAVPDAADPGFIPDQGHVPGPSYKQFDLSKVPVDQVEILGQPFDEAIVTLVESTGFNVLVGDGVDETEVNLNFTGREVSLKSALDLLCLAYNLQYVVEDDAIIVTVK